MRKNFITDEQLYIYDQNIDSDNKIPSFMKENSTIREVLRCGLWLVDELIARDCSEVNIVALQFRAGRLSYGREPWEVHQKILREYEKLDMNCILLPSEMN